MYGAAGGQNLRLLFNPVDALVSVQSFVWYEKNALVSIGTNVPFWHKTCVDLLASEWLQHLLAAEILTSTLGSVNEGSKCDQWNNGRH